MIIPTRTIVLTFEKYKGSLRMCGYINASSPVDQIIPAAAVVILTILLWHPSAHKSHKNWWTFYYRWSQRNVFNNKRPKSEILLNNKKRRKLFIQPSRYLWVKTTDMLISSPKSSRRKSNEEKGAKQKFLQVHRTMLFFTLFTIFHGIHLEFKRITGLICIFQNNTYVNHNAKPNICVDLFIAQFTIKW